MKVSTKTKRTQLVAESFYDSYARLLLLHIHEFCIKYMRHIRRNDELSLTARSYAYAKEV